MVNGLNKALVAADANRADSLSNCTYQMVNKHKVALGFDKAASQYNNLATIQHEIAEYGLTALELMGIKNAVNLLDIGCGTGTSYERLQGLAQRVTGVDISFNMLRQASISDSNIEKVHFNGINGDAECLPIKSHSIDAIYSSMALQWCQSPELVVTEIHRVLKPKGKALLCILTGDSFNSLQNGWRHIGLPSRINKFHSSHAWVSASEGFNWIVKAYAKRFVSQHNNLFDMLGSIKNIGANTKLMDPPGLRFLNTAHKVSNYMGKREVNGLSRYLKACNAGNELLPLEYHLICLEINK